MGWGTRARLLPLIVLLSLGIAPAVARASWTGLGGTLNASPSDNVDTISATAVNGVPYVAWEEVVSGGLHELYVKHWNGSAWVQDGGALNLNPGESASTPSIADVGGVPYVAFFEGPAGAFSIYVKHWNGTAWIQDGASVSSNVAPSAIQPSIASVDGVPYVAFAGFNSTSQNDQIYVEHLSGASWVLDGAALTSSTVDSETPVIASIAGTPYVTYITGSQSQVDVDSFDGSNWNQVGGALNVGAGAAAFPSIVNVGGVPWVSFQEARKIYVEQFDGQAWRQVGGALNLNGSLIAAFPSIAEIGATPYVAFAEINGSALDVDVVQWNGTAWNQVGGSLTSAASGAQPPSLTNLGGVPFVAFSVQPAGSAIAELNASLLAPDFSAEQAIPTDTGALLTARVRDYGAAWPIGFSYGPGASLGSSTPVQTTDGTGSSTIVQAVSGLSPASAYSWQPFALLDGRPIAFGTVGAFTTEPTNGPGPTGLTGAIGPAGPTGAPGQIELVTCHPVTKTVTRRIHGHKRKVKVTVQKCSAKLVSGPVTFTVASAHAASLTRGRVVYARVEVLRSPRTLRLIVVHRMRRLSAGRYTLVSGRTRQVVQLVRR